MPLPSFREIEQEKGKEWVWKKECQLGLSGSMGEGDRRGKGELYLTDSSVTVVYIIKEPLLQGSRARLPQAPMSSVCAGMYGNTLSCFGDISG